MLVPPMCYDDYRCRPRAANVIVVAINGLRSNKMDLTAIKVKSEIFTEKER